MNPTEDDLRVVARNMVYHHGMSAIQVYDEKLDRSRHRGDFLSVQIWERLRVMTERILAEA